MATAPSYPIYRIIKYTIEFTEKDSMKFLRSYFSYRFFKYNLKSRLYESFVAAFVAFLVMQIRHFTFKQSFFVSILALVLMFLIYPYYNLVKAYILMKWKDKKAPRKDTYEIEVSEDGISFSGQVGNSLWKLDQIENVSKQKDNFIFEFKNKRLAYIPMNGFRSKEMLSNFTSDIEKYLGSQQHA